MINLDRDKVAAAEWIKTQNDMQYASVARERWPAALEEIEQMRNVLRELFYKGSDGRPYMRRSHEAIPGRLERTVLAALGEETDLT